MANSCQEFSVTLCTNTLGCPLNIYSKNAHMKVSCTAHDVDN